MPSTTSGLKLGVFLRRRPEMPFDGQVGLGAVIDLHLDAIGLDVGDDGLELGIAAHARIGADQGALADLGRHHAQRGALAGAEHHRGGQAQGAEKWTSLYVFLLGWDVCLGRQLLQVGPQAVVDEHARF